MEYMILSLLLGCWAFVWYKLGYVNAELKESNKKIKEILREIQRDVKDIKREIIEYKTLLKNISDRHEEIINRP